MSRPQPESVLVTPQVLRNWRLPEPTGGKEARGSILVVGASTETVGAVLLAAEAALRSGAGKLQVVVPSKVAPHVSISLPEALVRGVPAAEEDPAGAALRLADEAQAVVGLGGATSWVAAADGRLWEDQSGGAGLGVSGSGDVRAGVVAGLLARGAESAQAAVWAAYLHGRAGERLAARVGRLGFLVRELPAEIPRGLAEVDL